MKKSAFFRKRITFPYGKIISFAVSGILLSGWIGGYLSYRLLPYTYRDLNPVTMPTMAEPVATPDARGDWTFDNLLIRLNEARLANGERQLGTDNYLSKYAQQDLDNNCPVTSHSNLRSLADTGVFKNYSGVAEDLGNVASYATPEIMISTFLASPTHKDILLDSSYTRVGIGVVDSPTHCVSFIFAK